MDSDQKKKFAAIGGSVLALLVAGYMIFMPSGAPSVSPAKAERASALTQELQKVTPKTPEEPVIEADRGKSRRAIKPQ